jgi:porin-like protein
MIRSGSAIFSRLGVGLCATAAARAADVSVQKAEPVAYVRICPDHVKGFFYIIPGTDTCVRIGGRARGEYGLRVSAQPRRLRHQRDGSVRRRDRRYHHRE